MTEPSGPEYEQLPLSRHIAAAMVGMAVVLFFGTAMGLTGTIGLLVCALLVGFRSTSLPADRSRRRADSGVSADAAIRLTHMADERSSLDATFVPLVAWRRSLRRPRWRPVELLNGSLDVPAIGLHGLHVQAPISDQAVAHDEDRDPTHREGRPVNVVTVSVPLAPLDFSVHRYSDQF